MRRWLGKAASCCHRTCRRVLGVQGRAKQISAPTPKRKRTRQHLPACNHLPPLLCGFAPTLLRNGSDDKGTFVPINGTLRRAGTKVPLSRPPLAVTVGAQVFPASLAGMRAIRSAWERGPPCRRRAPFLLLRRLRRRRAPPASRASPRRSCWSLPAC